MTCAGQLSIQLTPIIQHVTKILHSQRLTVPSLATLFFANFDVGVVSMGLASLSVHCLAGECNRPLSVTGVGSILY